MGAELTHARSQGYLTIVATFVAAIIFLGFLELGTQLENPFGGSRFARTETTSPKTSADPSASSAGYDVSPRPECA